MPNTYYVDNNLYDGHAEDVCQARDGLDNDQVKLAATAESGSVYEGYGISVWKTSDGSNLQRLRCTAYNGTTKIATVNANWPIENPDSNYSYEITVGSDANTGASEGTGSTGAWQTLQKAMDEVAAGDTVWVKAGRAHTDDDDGDTYCAAIQTAGTATAPISFIGYKTTKGDAETFRAAHPETHPSDSALDDYRVVIDGDPKTLARGIHCPDLDGASLYYLLANFRVQDCTNRGFSLVNTSENKITLKNCRADTNLVGIYGYDILLEACCVGNNTSTGVVSMSTMIVFANDVLNNGGDGLALAGPGCSVEMNRILGNGEQGLNMTASGGATFVRNNTFDGDGKPAGKAAIYMNEIGSAIVVNNVIHDFDIGAKCLGGNPGERFVVRNNLFTNCNTPRVNFPEGMGDVIASDPKFVDEANGDYRLIPGSPARGTGYPPYMDIGAEQRKEQPADLIVNEES